MPPGHPSVTSIRCGVRRQSGDTALGRATGNPEELDQAEFTTISRDRPTQTQGAGRPKPISRAPRLRAGYVKEQPLAIAIDATLPPN